MKPYQVCEEGETHGTYEYQSAYTGILLIAALILGVGMAMPNDAVSILGGFLVAAYFVLKLWLGNDAASRIKAAMRTSTVQISGRKFSFTSPLRIRVSK